MNTLVRLYGVKKWASLRNLFSKPSSAIVTILLVLVYGMALTPLLHTANKPAIASAEFTSLVFTTLGANLLLLLMTLMQKRKSLFFVQDSYYLFVGPYTNKHILSYLCFDIVLSSLLMALLSMLPLTLFASQASISFVLILPLFAASALLQYFALGLIDYLYLKEMIHSKKSKAQLVAVLLLAVCVLGVAAYSLVSANFNLSKGFQLFLNSPLFHYVPLFGWAKLALVSLYSGNLVGMLLGFGLLAAACVTITLLLVHTKGYFFEQSMIDAENFTEYYKKAKSGNAGDMASGKAHHVNMTFMQREKAIFSKSLLVTLKGRTLIGIPDIIVVGMYILMAKFMDFGYLAFTVMVLFWMFSMMSASALLDDLRNHYVYLIPGKPMKKLVYTIALPFLKTCLSTLLSLVIGGFVLGAGPMQILQSSVIAISFILLFTAGNVISIRLMKSRSNKMVENTLRMLIVVVALLPSLAILIILNILTIASGSSGVVDALIIPVVTVFNLLVGLLALKICSPMMSGNEVNSD